MFLIGLTVIWPGFDSSPTYLAQDTSDLRSLWDDQQSPLASASDNIWSQPGLWTDMGRSNGPTSSYVGGLSVAAQQQQQQQQQDDELNRYQQQQLQQQQQHSMMNNSW